MAKIQSIKARWILDSRGNPTVETEVRLEDGALGRAGVPSGASTGAAEALELRDGGDYFMGKGVNKAVNNVNGVIAPNLIGYEASDQDALDHAMLNIDGTDNKSELGANAILSVSLAAAKAEANSEHLTLYRYIAKMVGNDVADLTLPMPMMNVMNGGAHASWSTDIQEFMIIPLSAPDFPTALERSCNVFHNLAKVLKDCDYPTTVGDEGGYAPRVQNGNAEPLHLIEQAINRAGYRLGEDFVLALDVASSEFYHDGIYDMKVEGRQLNSDQMIEFIDGLVRNNPIVSVEDGLAEEDWDNWAKLEAKLGDQIQLVGDDLLVTNVARLQKAISLKAANSILIKPNQIGSLSETIRAVQLAKANGFTTVMSHRSGETEDTTIAHLAVGLNCQQIKTGSLSRTDRVAKYNELLRIYSDSNNTLRLANPFSNR